MIHSICDFVHEWRWGSIRLEMGKSSHLSKVSWMPLTNTTKLFILEGIPAIFCGIYTFFFLPNCEHYIIPITWECSYVLASSWGMLT